jgi:hypothetical protein
MFVPVWCSRSRHISNCLLLSVLRITLLLVTSIDSKVAAISLLLAIIHHLSLGSSESITPIDFSFPSLSSITREALCLFFPHAYLGTLKQSTVVHPLYNITHALFISYRYSISSTRMSSAGIKVFKLFIVHPSL